MFKFKGDAPLKRKQQRARQSPRWKKSSSILKPNLLTSRSKSSYRDTKSVAGVIGESDRPSQTGTTPDIVYSALMN